MDQRKSETPREFYYRLNKTTAKAGIDICSTSKLRDQHVKTFIRKLTDKQLRATLQGQRIRSMTDLEFILKQNDEDRHEKTDASLSRVRDFRADNQHMRHYRPKQFGKAYVVTHSEDESEDGDDEWGSSSEDEEPPTKSDLSVPKANQSESFAKQKDAWKSEMRQEVTQEVFRIMDNSGWKHPNGTVMKEAIRRIIGGRTLNANDATNSAILLESVESDCVTSAKDIMMASVTTPRSYEDRRHLHNKASSI
ncbi:hypothetical protein PHMEG_00013370 [Phytophthora megakarya]|uniref:Uncharacterized protein n=1 Tax=Phytophthora megakarya TaxID=4795 RepID=A0A225W6V9_9STRA|nr:hypothetical protein PHMEG_00013370 [Phytophthora megakarya]